jgi:hypothetical protein
MKKHPIDDLFNQQLKDFEAPSSDDLRKQFLERLEEKSGRKKGGFILWRPYFAAAASVALILGLGWSIFNFNNDNSSGKSKNIAANAPSSVEKVAIQPNIELPIEAELKNKEFSKQVASLPNDAKSPINKGIEKKAERVNDNSIVELNQARKIQPLVPATGVLELDERIPDELTLALESSVRKQKQEAVINDIKKDGIFTKAAGETIIIVASEFEKEEQIYLPEINEDSPISLAEATEIGENKSGIDKTFISKVFTEIKHFKHGEKVTLDEIDEHIVVAYNEDTFIGHEAMELRQKVNWLKDKLSK